jgi:SNF2 family DNA or RNA helicase
MLRRAYTDPLVVQSLEAAGLKMPEIDYQILRVEPTQEQAKLMVASIDLFQQHFERYRAEAQAEAEAAGRAFTLNASRVLPLMMRLRVAATIPDRFNLQLAKLGIKEPIYTGQPGGAKLPLIVDLVNAKVRQGQKVVIFSFFKEMQRLLGEHLAHHNPIVFQTSWSEDERFEAIESFHTDDSKKLTIGSPLSFGEGVDLSPADVCICSDLLWVPGKMAQAWSRILKALPQDRKCEIYRVLLHHSIDEHMWSVFYNKQVAQEQAFDRRIVTRRETAIDIQAFVDMVLASRTEINELLIEDRGEEELVYTPLVSMLSRIDERD